MAVKTWALALLLVATVAGAQQRRDDFGCKRETLLGSPEGVRAGVSGCHIVTDSNTGISYRFAGSVGQATGWIGEDQTSVGQCGDGVRNGNESCDRRTDGTGDKGVCAQLADCVLPGVAGECTCSPVSPCGDGDLDAGEECDPNAPDDPEANPAPLCPNGGPSCQGDCTCLRQCGNGMVEPGEECEPEATGTTTNYGSALDFSGGGVINTGLDNTLEPGTDDVIIKAWVQPSLSGTQRIYYDGGVADGNNGISLSVASNGQLVLEIGNTTTDPCRSAAGAVSTGAMSHVIATKSGTACAFWVRTLPATTHSPSVGGDVTTHATIGTNAINVHIGGRDNGNDRFLGILDEVNVYMGAGLVAALVPDAEDSLDCSASGLDARWDMNSASTSTITDCVSGQNSSNQSAGWVKVTSPFSSTTGGGTGCTGGESCNDSNCLCETTGSSPGERFIGPSGNDQNDGRTSGTAWRTWARAQDINRNDTLGPGITLTVLNGTTIATAGYPDFRCAFKGSSPANTRNGSSGQRWKIRAQNPGQVRLDSAGLKAAIRIVACDQWEVEGLTVTSADNPGPGFDFHGGTFTVTQGCDSAATPCEGNPAQNWAIRNVLGFGNNKEENHHVMAIEQASSGLIENVELYSGHRHQLSLWRSRNITVRATYANARSQDDIVGGRPSSTGQTTVGDENIAAYQSSNCLIENVITENDGSGIVIQGGQVHDGTDGGRDNRVLGSISFSDNYAFGVNPRFNVYPNGNLFRDIVSIETGPQTHGINVKSSIATRVEQFSVLGATTNSGVGVSPDSCMDCAGTPACDLDAPNPTCGVTLLNGVAVNNAMTDINVSASWETCSVTGVYTNDALSLPGGCTTGTNDTGSNPAEFGLTGDDCVVYVKSTSTELFGTGVGGANKGAGIICRYQDGALLTGAANSVWAQSGSTGANCTGLGCAGAFYGGVSYIVPGLNSQDGDSRFDVHERLNLDSNGSGCPIPACP